MASRMVDKRRLTLAELESAAQKPDYRRIGNWMARRVSRPLALRITWVLQSWDIGGNCATLAAWCCALAAVVGFATGTVLGWILGALSLHAWYLLDHVDGQLARLRRTASLAGVELDYLMHHVTSLLVPLGVGAGLARTSGQELWSILGVAWGVALLVLGLRHDARAKAFIQRLKCLEGRLHVVGGGGGRPAPAPPIPRGAGRRLAWLARKSCEMHVLLNVLSCVALVTWLTENRSLGIAQIMAAVLAALAIGVTIVTLWRDLGRQAAEQEFAAWYRVPEGETLCFDGRRWRTMPIENVNEPKEQTGQSAARKATEEDSQTHLVPLYQSKATID